MRVEVHTNERDFIGPITVDGSGKALFVRMRLEGPRPADLLLMPRGAGEQSLALYTQQPAAGPLAGPPMFGDVIQPNLEYQRALPVPAGVYYLVIDNTGSAGQVGPAPFLGVGVDAPAIVNYAIEIGDAG
jgi:hypothetical protein